MFRPTRQKMAGLCYVTPVTGHKAYTGKEVPHPLWNLNFHYHVNKSLPLDPTIYQVNTVNMFTFCNLKIHFNIVLPSACMSSKWSLPFTFSD
jgi:hypothetical protein